MEVDAGSKRPRRFALARDPMFRAADQATIALFVAQLDDQTRRLLATVDGLSVADLEWQPHPGRNTVGMLLAHIAQTEAFWMAVAAGEATDQASGERACREVIGLGLDDDGMPLPADGRHPAVLAGHDLAKYADLLRRARTYLKSVASGWTDADLAASGVYAGDEFGREWTLYHLLEHFAQHAGQVGLVLALRRRAG